MGRTSSSADAGGFVCPADTSSLEGMACSVEGATCGGPCMPCGFCNVVSCNGETWLPIEIPPSACDAGARVDASAPDAATSGAVISWQAPGGEAGTGPALTILGDGTVHIWDAVPAFSPTASPTTLPDHAYAIGAPAVDALLRLFAALDWSDLPHAPDVGDCYATVYVSACPGCETRVLQYHDEASLEPNADGVFAWFQMNLPFLVPAAQPMSWCRFH